VLKLTRGRIQLDIELKEQGYEKAAVDLALQYCKIDDFIMTSFKSRCLESIKRYNPEIKLGLILGQHQFKEGALPIKQALDAGAAYLMLEYKLANDKVLKSARESGLTVMVWTVNEKTTIERYLSHNDIYGIITNYTDIAVELREAKE